MLPLENSAILLTCIKRYLVLKTNFWSFESDRFTQVYLTFCVFAVSADPRLSTGWPGLWNRGYTLHRSNSMGNC